MRIECPGCKLSGNIDDATVPATGLSVTCPRCKKQFTVERPVLQAGEAAAMLDTCPSCQYGTFSEEKFSVCPKCGLVVADYQRQMLAARKQQRGRVQPAGGGEASQAAQTLPRLTAGQLQKEEEARRKYGLDDAPETGTTSSSIAGPVADAPLPVLVAGWGVIIVSLVVIGIGIGGVVEYLAKAKEAEAALAALEEAPGGPVLFLQYLLFPTLSILVSIGMIFFGTQFLALKKWSINAMLYGAWGVAGILALMKIADMIFWFRRASADASFGYYAMGVLGDVLLMAIYVVPFLVLAEYLKSTLFEKSEELFY